MIQILMIDDDISILDYLEDSIKSLYPHWTINKATSYSEGFSMAIEKNYNLIILDYNLSDEVPENTGLKLGIELKNISKYKNTPMVFESSYIDQASNAVNNLNCIYFLSKPYTSKNIKEMLEKLVNSSLFRKSILLLDDYGINTFINEDEILFAKTNGHKLHINTINGQFVCVNYSLADFIGNCSTIVQCHKSYAFNENHLLSIDKSTNVITLIGKEKTHSVPIGRKYKESILQKVGK